MASKTCQPSRGPQLIDALWNTNNKRAYLYFDRQLVPGVLDHTNYWMAAEGVEWIPVTPTASGTIIEITTAIGIADPRQAISYAGPPWDIVGLVDGEPADPFTEYPMTLV